MVHEDQINYGELGERLQVARDGMTTRESRTQMVIAINGVKLALHAERNHGIGTDPDSRPGLDMAISDFDTASSQKPTIYDSGNFSI